MTLFYGGEKVKINICGKPTYTNLYSTIPIPAYRNWVRFSTESDGVTIYNGGLGYKNGYRVRSGGEETAVSGCSCSGFIPVKDGDVVRISGWDFTGTAAGDAINVADASFTNLGQTAMNSSYGYGIFSGENYGNAYVIEESEGVWKYIIPSGFNIAYIRISSHE